MGDGLQSLLIMRCFTCSVCRCSAAVHFRFRLLASKTPSKSRSGGN
jgi:hypothetical protein